MPSVLGQVLYLIEQKHIQVTKVDLFIQRIRELEDQRDLPAGYYEASVSIPLPELNTHWRKFDSHLADMLGYDSKSEAVAQGLDQAFDELTVVDQLIIDAIHQETQRVKKRVLDIAFADVRRHTYRPLSETSEAFSELNKLQSELEEERIRHAKGEALYSTVAKDLSEAIDEALDDMQDWMPRIRAAVNRVSPASGWKTFSLLFALLAIIVVAIIGWLQLA